MQRTSLGEICFLLRYNADELDVKGQLFSGKRVICIERQGRVRRPGYRDQDVLIVSLSHLKTLTDLGVETGRQLASVDGHDHIGASRTVGLLNGDFRGL
jgi:hypothetical protein